MTVLNAISDGGGHDVLAAAKEDQESVVELTRELIRLPSRGGVDPYEPVLERLKCLAGAAAPGCHGAQGHDQGPGRPDL